MPHDLYETAKDFQPILAAVVALLAAGGAYLASGKQAITAMSTLKSQLGEARRKEADEILRLRCAETIRIEHATGTVAKYLKIKEVSLASVLKERLQAVDGMLKLGPASYTWEYLLTLGPVMDRAPGLVASLSDVSHASLVSQKLFYGVSALVDGADERFQTLVDFTKRTGFLPVEQAEGVFSILSKARIEIEQYEKDVADEVLALAKAHTIAEHALKAAAPAR